MLTWWVVFDSQANIPIAYKTITMTSGGLKSEIKVSTHLHANMSTNNRHGDAAKLLLCGAPVTLVVLPTSHVLHSSIGHQELSLVRPVVAELAFEV